MLSWSKNRIALVGDTAHTIGFTTVMETALAIQDAGTLAKALYELKGNYKTAFEKYEETYKPFIESDQAKLRMD